MRLVRVADSKHQALRLYAKRWHTRADKSTSLESELTARVNLKPTTIASVARNPKIALLHRDNPVAFGALAPRSSLSRGLELGKHALQFCFGQISAVRHDGGYPLRV